MSIQHIAPWDAPNTPDPRFRVAFIAAHGVTIFVNADSEEPISRAHFEFVPGTRIVLLGNPHEQLRLLIDNYTTKELVEKLSVQPAALHRLRLALGMPTGPTGQRGGARPKAGRKKAQSGSGDE